mmetsp:Transcript_11571/g.31001  ORF Transcript_11571/g.31001 Transcript_11571/m.31001 type:complete len:146 (+) Transcript_11571:337-774(+)
MAVLSSASVPDYTCYPRAGGYKGLMHPTSLAQSYFDSSAITFLNTPFLLRGAAHDEDAVAISKKEETASPPPTRARQGEATISPHILHGEDGEDNLKSVVVAEVASIVSESVIPAVASLVDAAYVRQRKEIANILFEHLGGGAST